MLEKIPELEAEESIRMAARVAVGAGTLAPADRQRITNSWDRARAGRAVMRGAPEGVKAIRVRMPKKVAATN